MGNGELPLTATLLGYYGVCPREAWLMGHALEPFPDHELLALGRLLQETTYPRERKEVQLPGMRLDLVPRSGQAMVVAEVKRGSGARRAHLLQLGYYLVRLRELGLEAVGELRYPRERKVERVVLTEELARQVEEAIRGLVQLLQEPRPPPVRRIAACSGCAYSEFCFAGEEAVEDA
ncbi:CRISPR-associated protein Cas4 [Thermus tengchongensis]|uniref:CRISPR-associated protein Cas4 n=1 Tax=Thermus tengchongensis TaxID=1214928 RepID=UPI0005712920|nr:CRISPR-associated protein Cas4 [Thermus tengchongensis]